MTPGRFFATLSVVAGLTLGTANLFGQLEQAPPPPPPGTYVAPAPVQPQAQPQPQQPQTVPAPGAPQQQPAPNPTPAPNAAAPAGPAPPAASQTPAPVPAPAPGAPAPNAPVIVPAPPPPNTTPAPQGQVSTGASSPGPDNWVVAWFKGYWSWAKEHYVRAAIYIILICALVFLAFRYFGRFIAWLGNLGRRGGPATTAIIIAICLAASMSAATLNPDALSAGVPGNNYDVVFSGTGLAAASGASFWCPGVVTTLVSVSDTVLKMRVTIPATAPSGQICGLRVLGVGTIGYQDFPNRFAVGSKDQYGAAQLVPFVSHYSELADPTARQQAAAAQAALQSIRAANASTASAASKLQNQVNSLKNEVATLKAAPKPAPADSKADELRGMIKVLREEGIIPSAPAPQAAPAPTPAPQPNPAPAPSASVQPQAASASSAQALADAVGKMRTDFGARLNELSVRTGYMQEDMTVLRKGQEAQGKINSMLIGASIQDAKTKSVRCQRTAAAEAAGVKVNESDKLSCK